VKVSGPLNPSTDVVSSSVHVYVVDDSCVHLCHSDGITSTNVSFVVVALSPYNLSDVVVSFGDGATLTAPEDPRRTGDVLAPPPPWAAECYRRGRQSTIIWHDYGTLGYFTPAAFTKVCNVTCGHSLSLTVGSPDLFAEAVGAADVRRVSVRRVNASAWDVTFLVGAENAAGVTAMLDFDDGTSSPVMLRNASLFPEQLPYPHTWSIGHAKHTYRQLRNYTVALTIASQVNQLWTVQADTLVSPLVFVGRVR